MKSPRERILLVENDLDVIDVVARQTLEAVGYQVDIATDATQALQAKARPLPDAIIVNLTLPGLSGKDLLVALNSQGLETPVIVVARKGMESDIIQAFRLGASDYLLWPAREAEIVAAVERTLKGVRGRQERDALARQLKSANEELKQRVKELTTIFAVGKAVTSVTDLRSLFEKIVEGAVYVTGADLGWLLLREERSAGFILRAQRGLPQSVAARVGQTWEDGVSSLVAQSGEALLIHGEPLRRFKAFQLGKSALVVPLKVKKEVVGLLVVMRKAANPFTVGNTALLEAVADYASISIINARLFRALEERARSYQQLAENAQQRERQREGSSRELRKQLEGQACSASQALNSLLATEDSRLNATQKSTLRSVYEGLQRLTDLSRSFDPSLQKP